MKTTTTTTTTTELLKLYTYTMHDYPIALHLDLDFIILKPLDPLFDVFLTPDHAVKYIPHAHWPADRVRKQRVESMFTRDYPMSRETGIPSNFIGMQGGFLLVRPNQTAFEELVGLVQKGNYRTPQGGWYDGDVQYPGFYGSPQIQGLIGFYYGHYHPDQTVELNRCLHNNMAENPHDKEGVCRAPVGDECENCRTKNVTELYSAHFTFCLKPVRYCVCVCSSGYLCAGVAQECLNAHIARPLCIFHTLLIAQVPQ